MHFKADLRRFNSCLRLLYATFLLRTARVIPKSYRTLLISYPDLPRVQSRRSTSEICVQDYDSARVRLSVAAMCRRVLKYVSKSHDIFH